jgi:hypothetical protein
MTWGGGEGEGGMAVLFREVLGKHLLCSHLVSSGGKSLPTRVR